MSNHLKYELWPKILSWSLLVWHIPKAALTFRHKHLSCLTNDQSCIQMRMLQGHLILNISSCFGFCARVPCWWAVHHTSSSIHLKLSDGVIDANEDMMDIHWMGIYIYSDTLWLSQLFHKRHQTQESALLMLLMLGLSGRFWLHASLLRFRQIGFLRPWQSLALPLAVILPLLSLMEAGTVNSIHYVPPSAAGPHREHNKCPKLTPDAPSAPQNKPNSKKNYQHVNVGMETRKIYLCSMVEFYNLHLIQPWGI